MKKEESWLFPYSKHASKLALLFKDVSDKIAMKGEEVDALYRVVGCVNKCLQKIRRI